LKFLFINYFVLPLAPKGTQI